MSAEQKIPTQVEEENTSENLSEWLSFALDNVTYAIDILRVLEIRTWENMTRIPYAKPYINGLINLRGAIVPIANLRTRFGIEEVEPTKETVVLIMNIKGTKGDKTMGIIVDRISEVVNLDEDEIESADKFELAISEQFVSGIADLGGKMAVLLDIDAVLNIEEF